MDLDPEAGAAIPVDDDDDDDDDDDLGENTPKGDGKNTSSSRASTGLSPDYEKIRIEGEEENSGSQDRERTSTQMHPLAPETPTYPTEEAQQPKTPVVSQVATIPAHPCPPPRFGGPSGSSGSSLTLNDLFHALRDGFRGVNERFERLEGSMGRDLSKLKGLTERVSPRALATQGPRGRMNGRL